MPARDVFICHAHLDRDSHARPLALALGREAVSCWVDEGQILPGDSLFRSINEGLAGARQVLLLMTERFLGRPWTEREMEAATSLEIEAGRTVVIPVLDIDRRVLLERYPLLAAKVGLDWAAGAQQVAAGVARRFDRRPAADWALEHPVRHVGPIWTRLTPASDCWGQSHELTLRWGPFIWRGSVCPERSPVSLTHHKELADQIPLLAEVSPPAIITVGQGNAPDADTIDIDEGWQRMSGWVLSGEDRRTRRLAYEHSAERAKWLERLRQEYVLSHDDVAPAIAAGTELPPREWLSRRLEALGLAHLLDRS